LTNQIADALWFHQKLKPRGVFVMVEGQHLCMMMRGIKKQRAETITTSSRGAFAIGENAHRHREEILQIIRREKKHVSPHIHKKD
jgi:GTP cyclohydrolase I